MDSNSSLFSHKYSWYISWFFTSITMNTGCSYSSWLPENIAAVKVWLTELRPAEPWLQQKLGGLNSGLCQWIPEKEMATNSKIFTSENSWTEAAHYYNLMGPQELTLDGQPCGNMGYMGLFTFCKRRPEQLPNIRVFVLFFWQLTKSYCCISLTSLPTVREVCFFRLLSSTVLFVNL